MIIEDGRFAFGFWEGMPYGGSATDKYEDFLEYKNTLRKEDVIRHIESLDDWISSELSQDLFTGERFNCGIYMDGNFVFPVDFLRYYKSRNIGIPYEYEAYLRKRWKETTENQSIKQSIPPVQEKPASGGFLVSATVPVNLLAEGGEEYLQEVLDPVYRNIMLGEDNKIRLYSEDALYAGMLGIITAGIVNGSAGDVGKAVYAEAGKAVKNIGKTVGLINRAIHMDGTEAQTMARNIRNHERYNNDAAVGELYVQMLRDGGDGAFVLEGAEVVQPETANDPAAVDNYVEEAYNGGETKKTPKALVNNSFAEVENAILSGAVSTAINPNKQVRHLKDQDGYIVGRSYIIGDFEAAQRLVDELKCTGMPVMAKGKWTNKERVTSENVIGIHIDPRTGEEAETKNGLIIYSKTGSHIVPRKDD